jgi:hypothetical protein
MIANNMAENPTWFFPNMSFNELGTRNRGIVLNIFEITVQQSAKSPIHGSAFP